MKFGDVLARLIKARGWQKPAAEGAVFGAWAKVVGPEISVRCRPVNLEDRELTVEAESTAWATQLRAIAPKIIKRIAAEVGDNVVVRVPFTAQRRRHGPKARAGSKATAPVTPTAENGALNQSRPLLSACPLAHCVSNWLR